VLDAELQGAGRLDYSNVAPWAVIDRSIIVFHGPEKSPVFLSIDGTPLEATVPAGGAGSKPLVIDHHGLTSRGSSRPGRGWSRWRSRMNAHRQQGPRCPWARGTPRTPRLTSPAHRLDLLRWKGRLRSATAARPAATAGIA
jgi:hypothetical protein